MAVEPSHLIAGLLAAHAPQPLSAAMFTRAGELFGFPPGTIRVALTRAKQRGTIEASQRGRYVLGPRGRAIEAQVVGWRAREALTRPWDGEWLVLSTAGLSRTDRRAVRQRGRALELWGFAAAAPDLEIRPHNRVETLAEMRDHAATVAPEAPLFLATDLPETSIARAVEVWNPRALEDRYARMTTKLSEAAAETSNRDIGPAAKIAFEVGDIAIRAIVADPLLPESLVDVDARRRFFETMRRFDELGRHLWKNLLKEVIA